MLEDYKKYEPIFNSWYIKKAIGEGSFGKVYEIEKVDFGVTYQAALKVITIPQSQSEIKSLYADGMDQSGVEVYLGQVVKDVVKEFELMSKLKGNGHIVSYEDHMVMPLEGDIGWDILIKMELLTSFIDHMNNHQISQKEVIKLGIDICKALESCQKHNIIHRDVKPENIFVSESGDYKLGDFGIARQVEKMTSALSKKGTNTYMAPEVYCGQDYDMGADIYSLGIVLYRLLNNNRTPFLPQAPEPITHGNREQALAKRFRGEKIPPPIAAQGRLVEIVLKACAFDPKERYDSPMAMRKELEVVGHVRKEQEENYPLAMQDNIGDICEKTESVFPPLPHIAKKSNKKKWIIVGSIAMVMVLLVIAALFFMQYEKDSDQQISISGVKNVMYLTVGEKYQLEVAIEPESMERENLTYKVTHPEIAFVSSNGKVIALADGETDIIIRIKDYEKRIQLIVEPNQEENLLLDQEPPISDDELQSPLPQEEAPTNVDIVPKAEPAENDEKKKKQPQQENKPQPQDAPPPAQQTPPIQPTQQPKQQEAPKEDFEVAPEFD